MQAGTQVQLEFKVGPSVAKYKYLSIYVGAKMYSSPLNSTMNPSFKLSCLSCSHKIALAMTGSDSSAIITAKNINISLQNIMLYTAILTQDPGMSVRARCGFIPAEIWCYSSGLNREEHTVIEGYGLGHTGSNRLGTT